jgi:CheY-like chemotaxis protein
MPAQSNEKLICLLVVDDEAIVRMVTADVLDEAGFDVVEAANASEALVLLDARPDISLMLTDVRMPGELDGYKLSRIVRRKYAAIGIIVISGDSPPAEGDLPQGACFLGKPLLPSGLLNAVRATLAQRPAVPRDLIDQTEKERPPSMPPPAIADQIIEPTATGTGFAQLSPRPTKPN